MKADKIKGIAQERINQRKEYNIRRIKALLNQPFETDGDKVIIPHEVFVESRHNNFAPLFEHICKRLSDDS